MHVTVGGGRVAYADSGTGSVEDTAVLLLGDVGLGPWQWAWQHAALVGPFRVLVPAWPGTGDSAGRPRDVDGLVEVVEAVCRDAGVGRVHLVGAGLGGAVALAHARRHGRARRLALVGTAAAGTVVDREAARAVYGRPDRLEGLFTDAFLEARPDVADRVRRWRREEDAEGEALTAALDAFVAFSAGPLYELTRPTLVFHARSDPVVPADAPGVGESLAADLPEGRFEPVAGRRLAHAEHAAVTDELVGFLEG
jgi:pimeloyl-ACP methyl ester carboxylesterase